MASINAFTMGVTVFAEKIRVQSEKVNLWFFLKNSLIGLNLFWPMATELTFSQFRGFFYVRISLHFHFLYLAWFYMAWWCQFENIAGRLPKNSRNSFVDLQSRKDGKRNRLKMKRYQNAELFNGKNALTYCWF